MRRLQAVLEQHPLARVDELLEALKMQSSSANTAVNPSINDAQPVPAPQSAPAGPMGAAPTPPGVVSSSLIDGLTAVFAEDDCILSASKSSSTNDSASGINHSGTDPLVFGS
jgi:hypothetical protein